MAMGGEAERVCLMPEGMDMASPNGASEAVFSGMVECPKLGGQAEKEVVREVRDDWCRARGLKCCIQFDISVEPAEQDMVDCVHEKSPGWPIPKSYAFSYLRDDTCRELGLYCCMGLSEQALARAMGRLAQGGEFARLAVGGAAIQNPRTCYITKQGKGYCFTKKLPTEVRPSALLEEPKFCPACGGDLRQDE